MWLEKNNESYSVCKSYRNRYIQERWEIHSESNRGNIRWQSDASKSVPPKERSDKDMDFCILRSDLNWYRSMKYGKNNK